MKFYISGLFENLTESVQVSRKSDKYDGYFTWRPMHVYDNISLSSSKNDKCFTKKLYRKSKHTFCLQ